MSRLFIYLVALFIFFNGQLFSAVIINEVAFNPTGNENHNEFVEIYNNSNLPIDLKGWQIGDQDEVDFVLAYPSSTTTILKPYSYCLIMDSSYPTGSSDYETLIPVSVLRLVIDDGSFGKYGFSNTTPETVLLKNNLGEIVDSYTYTIDQKEAYSEERLFFDQNIWQNSLVVNGTPGCKNSIVPLDFDLMVKFGESKSGALDISVVVKNIGLKDVNSFHLEILNPAKELVAQFDHELLASQDSLIFGFVRPKADGTNILYAVLEVDQDQNSQNNSAEVEFFNNLSNRGVTLNEFMKSPVSGEAEWVEIYNASSLPVKINDLAFRDQTSQLLQLRNNGYLAPNQYLILAKDSSLVKSGLIKDEQLALVSSWPALSATDALFLCDREGGVLDSLIYDGNWSEENGVSIEKINPNFNSSVVKNWVISVRKSTPGSQNSVFQSLVGNASNNQVRLQSKYFSPNMDGDKDHLLVDYSFNSPYIYLSAEVYNLKGHKVKTIFDKEYQPAKNSFVWDGKSANQLTALNGSYILYIEAKDAESKVFKFKEVFYLVK